MRAGSWLVLASFAALLACCNDVLGIGPLSVASTSTSSSGGGASASASSSGAASSVTSSTAASSSAGGASSSSASTSASASTAASSSVAASSSSSGDWCATNAPNAALCTDFDQGTSLPPPGWTVKTGVGAASVDTMVASSPPNAMLVTAPHDPNDTSSTGRGGYELQAMIPSGKETHLAFDVRVDAIDMATNTYVQIAAISFQGAGNDAYNLVLGVDAKGVSLNELDSIGMTDPSHGPVNVLPPATWVRLELVFTADTMAGFGGQVSLLANQANVMLEGAPSIAITNNHAYGAQKARVGIYFLSEPTIDQVVHIDNVVITAK